MVGRQFEHPKYSPVLKERRMGEQGGSVWEIIQWVNHKSQIDSVNNCLIKKRVLDMGQIKENGA